jgi:phosphoribosylglycinamide formyltransferase 1
MTTLAVLVSGAGSNLQAMIDSGIPIQLVVADKPCSALAVAANAGIPISLVDRRSFGYPGYGGQWQRKSFTQQIIHDLRYQKIDVVAMAGFMTILDPVIFHHFGGRILNIHPSLLPAFKGASAVRDALTAGVSETGTTVHIATEMLDDERYILGQVLVPVLPGDNEATLHERIKVQERQLYPRILQAILSGQINLDDVMQNN